jgi:hypothetical protein
MKGLMIMRLYSKLHHNQNSSYQECSVRSAQINMSLEHYCYASLFDFSAIKPFMEARVFKDFSWLAMGGIFDTFPILNGLNLSMQVRTIIVFK